MSHEKERAEFEAWYASAIWGNEDYKQSLFRAWREGREDLIRKLATVSVEPVAFHAQDGIVSVASHIDKDKFLFTTEAIAAARVQGIEEAAKVAEGYPKYGDATAAEIRALIT